MHTNNAKKEWSDYVARERAVLEPILAERGLTLEQEQPHVGGERYLMQAVTTHSGRKIIFLGRQGSQRVVIKSTDNEAGRRELVHERTCRKALADINFAYGTFNSPEELLYTEAGGRTIFVQKYIEQAQTFLERPIEEQFTLALGAFKAQESAHATTYRHQKLIERTFGRMDAGAYLRTFATFNAPEAAIAFLNAHKDTIEQYGDFLTHTDFVPHNIRIADGVIYLLDSSALRFGNKYEGWARFINFMELYNPPLARTLMQYVADNRTPEESLALTCMRIYRLGEIVHYYRGASAKSEGDLHALNEARIEFWSNVLSATLADQAPAAELIEAYKQKRDSLRSEDEKRRQVGLH